MLQRVRLIIISSCFLFMQISPSFAQDTIASSAASPSAKTTATPNATPTTSAEESESEDKYKDKKSKDTMLMIVQYVALAAVAFVAISLPLKCKKSLKKAPSAWIFLGVAVYYIVSEGMAIIQFKKKGKPSDLPLEIDKEGDIDQQVADLEKARDITDQAREHTQKRSKNAMVAAIGFLASAGVAGFEFFKMNAKKKKDKNPSTATSSPPPLCLTGNEPATEGGGGCPHVMSCSKDKSDKKTSYIEEDQSIEMSENEWNEFLKNLANEIIPTAHAQVPEENTNAIKTLESSVGKEGGKSDFMAKLYEKPSARMITFGAVASLAFVVSTMLKKKAKELEERRNRYQELIDELLSLKNQSVTVGTPSPTPTASTTAVNNGSTNTSSSTSTKNPATNYGGEEYGEGACVQSNLDIDPKCTCRLNNSCRTSSYPNLNNSFQGFKIPSALSSAVKSLGDASNNRYNGNLKGANAAEAQLGKYAKQLKTIKKGIEDKINQERKKNGDAAINFTEKERQILGALKSGAARRIQSQGLGSTLNNSSIAGGLSPNEEKELVQSEGSFLAALQGPGSSGALSGANGSSVSQEDEFDLSIGNNENEAFDTSLIENTDQNLENYNFNNADITKIPDASIFQILTYRYQKTAYPKFFNQLTTVPEDNKSPVKKVEKKDKKEKDEFEVDDFDLSL